MTDGKPIAVSTQPVSGINPLVAFYDIIEEKERCYYILLSSNHKIYSLGIGSA
jgi:hypothetical protein